MSIVKLKVKDLGKDLKNPRKKCFWSCLFLQKVQISCFQKLFVFLINRNSRRDITHSRIPGVDTFFIGCVFFLITCSSMMGFIKNIYKQKIWISLNFFLQFFNWFVVLISFIQFNDSCLYIFQGNICEKRGNAANIMDTLGPLR